MMLRIFLAAFALWLACASPARAAEEEAPCTAENSRKLDVAGLERAKDRYVDSCVQVTGIGYGAALFADQAALYRFHAVKTLQTRGVVGFAYDGKIWLKGPPRHVTAIGRVVDCGAYRAAYKRSARNAQRHAARSGELVMTHLYGFCAVSTGPALYVESVTQDAPVNLPRLTSDADRKAVGDLIPIPAQRASSGDVPTLVALMRNTECNPDYVLPEHIPYVRPGISNALDKRETLLAPLCKEEGLDQALFEVSPKSRARQKNSRIDLVFCLCRSASCKGKWPIALIDSNWDPARPYFCQRVYELEVGFEGSGKREYFFPEDNGLYYLEEGSVFDEAAAASSSAETVARSGPGLD